MMVIFKGKGVLVPVFIFLSFFIVIIFYHLFKDNLGLVIKDDDLFILFGPIVLLSGAMTSYWGRDYYKDKNGEKVEIDLDNRFLFIKMKLVGKLLILSGIFLSLYGVFYNYKS